MSSDSFLASYRQMLTRTIGSADAATLGHSALRGWVWAALLAVLSTPTAFAENYLIPLVMPASNSLQQGFVRIINHSDRSGTVEMHALDDAGRRFGPIVLSLQAKETIHFNSNDLELGNPEKRLPTGIGGGQGDWRLELSTELEIEPLAFSRTQDGFVTNLHDTVRQTVMDSRQIGYHVPIFNPASNTGQRSLLRLINTSDRRTEISIDALDDEGERPPNGAVGLSLDAGEARTVTARQLESGSSGLTGSLGDGVGKWQLFLTAHAEVLVMSLLESPTGHLANISASSDRQALELPITDPGGGTPASHAELTVGDPEIIDTTLTTEQEFRIRAEVRNRGNAPSSETTLIFYRSPDARISTQEVAVGNIAVPSLAEGETRSESIDLKTPSRAGVYYYSACIEPVRAEDAANNCSDAAKIEVESRTAFFGAIATSVHESECFAAIGSSPPGGAGQEIHDGDIAFAKDIAVATCRLEGGVDCQVTDTWVRGCASVAFGLDYITGHCHRFHYGGSADVTTLEMAKNGAVALCGKELQSCAALGYCDDRTFGAQPRQLRFVNGKIQSDP